MSCISSVEDWYKALFINTQYDFALLEEPFYILKCYEYCTPFPATAESRYSFPAGAGQTWIPEIRNESFDRVSPIIYFQEQPTAV